MSSENLLIAILLLLLLGITLFPQELLAPSSIHDDGLFSFSVGNISRSNDPFTPRCVIRQHAGNQHAAVRYSDFTLLFKRASCLPIGSGFLVEARLYTSEPKAAFSQVSFTSIQEVPFILSLHSKTLCPSVVGFSSKQDSSAIRRNPKTFIYEILTRWQSVYSPSL